MELAVKFEREEIRQRGGDLLHGNGKAGALPSPSLYRHVDPDQLAAQIDQRAAAVPGIDVGIRLQPVLEIQRPVAARHGPAVFRAQDAPGDGAAQAKGIARRNDGFAQQQIVIAGEANRREALFPRLAHNAQQRQVPQRRAQQLLGFVNPAIHQLHLHAIGPVDDVQIGQDVGFVANLVNDHARPDVVSLLLQIRTWRQTEEPSPHDFVGVVVLAHQLRRGDVDHARHDAFDGGHGQVTADVHFRRAVGDGAESVSAPKASQPATRPLPINPMRNLVMLISMGRSPVVPFLKSNHRRA